MGWGEGKGDGREAVTRHQGEAGKVTSSSPSTARVKGGGGLRVVSTSSSLPSPSHAMRRLMAGHSPSLHSSHPPS